MVAERPATISPDLNLELIDEAEGAEIRWVFGESIDIPEDPPDRWLAGKHLRGVVTTQVGQRGTPAPHALDPDSVVVRRGDQVLAAGVEFELDGVWGSIGSARETGVVEIDYRYSLRRIDTIATDPSGVTRVVRGVSHLTAPHPPEIPADWTAVANAYVPYFATPDAIELYPIGPVEPPEAPSSDWPTRARSALTTGQPLRITFWGDSVTAGGDASSPAATFPEVVGARLARQFAASKVSVATVAVSGSTSRDWLRAERAGCDWSLVAASHPDLVVVEFINDAGLPEDDWPALYEELRAKVRALGAELVITTPHWAMPEWMPDLAKTHEDRRPYVDFLRRLAAEHAVPLADVSAGWQALRSRGIPFQTLLNNGINHPDDRGHRLAAHIIADCIGGVADLPK